MATLDNSSYSIQYDEVYQKNGKLIIMITIFIIIVFILFVISLLYLYYQFLHLYEIR